MSSLLNDVEYNHHLTSLSVSILTFRSQLWNSDALNLIYLDCLSTSFCLAYINDSVNIIVHFGNEKIESLVQQSGRVK